MKIMNKLILLSYFVLVFSQLNTEVAHDVLEKYKQNDIFVCLGIYSCISLARALNAGFTELHGIDGDEVLVQHAKIIFPHDINSNPYNVTNYNIYHGGIEKVATIITKIKTPITFLLGSHLPNFDQLINNNVLQELDTIRNHPIKTHTILVEYINYAGTPYFGNITLESIKEKLLEINPNYSFSFEKGGHLEKEKNAILVAYIK